MLLLINGRKGGLMAERKRRTVMGRPKTEIKKDHTISANVSGSEHKKITKSAENMGLSISNYVRMLLKKDGAF